MSDAPKTTKYIGLFVGLALGAFTGSFLGTIAANAWFESKLGQPIVIHLKDSERPPLASLRFRIGRAQ